MRLYTCPGDNLESLRSDEKGIAVPSLREDNEREPSAAVDAVTLEGLLAQWQLEQGRRHRGLWQMALVPVIVSISVFVSIAMNWSPLATVALAAISLTTLTPFGIEGAALSSNGTAGLFARLQSALQEVQDLQAIGPLLAALDAQSTSDPFPTELRLAPALARLLTQLDQETSGEEAIERYLRPHIRELYAWLQRPEARERPELLAAALRLLPRLHGREALVCAAWFVVRSSASGNVKWVRDEAGTALTSLLATVDLGGPAILSGWIDRLAFGDVTLEWEDLLAPLAILQILPQITPADYLALDYRSRRRLYASLVSMNLQRLQTDYILSVLDLVRRAADLEALGVVRQLQLAGQPGVRTAARLCLPLLEAKEERERCGKTLLRGSGTPPEPVETLLRSAAGGTPDDPQLLLRADNR